MGGFGWNKYDNGVGRIDGLLHAEIANILSTDECDGAFPHGTIQSEIHLCARLRVFRRNTTRFGVCTGDDGGPLAHLGKYIIGILSRIPPDCNEREQPAVYTRITYYLSRIVHVMSDIHDSGMISLDAALYS